MGENDHVLHRLHVLELAQMLGNVTEACRQGGMTRTQYYAYKQRFEVQGLAGLKDRPPLAKSHPRTPPPSQVRDILKLSLLHPAWGCDRLSDYLKQSGIPISGPTIQSTLIKHNLGKKQDRLLELERRAIAKGHLGKLSEEQLLAIEDSNPCFMELFASEERTRPGELLAEMILPVGQFPGLRTVYLSIIVDTFCSYAFGLLGTNKLPESAIALLETKVLPCYAAWKLRVTTLQTGPESEFYQSPSKGVDFYAHPYQNFLHTHGIRHLTKPTRNGFLTDFCRIVRREFFTQRRMIDLSLETLQTDFDSWLVYYNTERSLKGYPNFGKRPKEVIDAYLALGKS